MTFTVDRDELRRFAKGLRYRCGLCFAILQPTVISSSAFLSWGSTPDPERTDADGSLAKGFAIACGDLPYESCAFFGVFPLRLRGAQIQSLSLGFN